MARLPKQIQAQLEQAEAIEKQMSEAAKPPPTELEAAALAPPPAPAQPEPQQPVSPSPEPPAAPQPPAPPPPPPQQIDWEHKFRTVQGMLSERDRRIDALERQLKEKPEAQKPQEKPAADPKDIEDFGKDLVEMVMRNSEKLMARYQALLEELGGRVVRLEQGVTVANETSAATAEQVFLTKLGQAVPEWEQINVDQRFLAWLAEVDPIYGQPRQAALEAAAQRFDSQRVVNIFKAFKQQLTAQAPSPSVLETQVSPSASAGTPQPQPAPNKPVFTQKQITDFYNDVARGRYRGRENDVAQIEAQINDAIAEGRVR